MEHERSLSEIGDKLADLLLNIWKLPHPNFVLSIGDIIGENQIREMLRTISKNSRITPTFFLHTNLFRVLTEV